ncbi:MAG: galactokinase, partial [Deltaproteobacteria bacterium]|nr:galactokinase [Deltaproteobacteria bacterium]
MDGAKRASNLFERTFGLSPAVIARAPGRVELLGNHTDYNQGLALALAIDRYLWVAAGQGLGAEHELVSEAMGTAAFGIDTQPAMVEPGWARYLAGVIEQQSIRRPTRDAIQLAVASELPMGVGLASSAALTVAAAVALDALWQVGFGPLELARSCQRAEHAAVGTQCGLLDPIVALEGRPHRALLVDFRALTWLHLPWPTQQVCLAITPSGASRALAETPYNERREQCRRAAELLGERFAGSTSLRDLSSRQLREAGQELDPVLIRRARHVVGENERVERAQACLERGDLVALGALLWESHDSSRDDFENSCAELDDLVALARSVDGALGARLTGGGFGGATLTLLRRGAEQAFARAVAQQRGARLTDASPPYLAGPGQG